MSRIFAANYDGNLSWSGLNSDGSAAASPNTTGSLKPGSISLYRAAAWDDTLVVAGSNPAAVYVYSGQSGSQGPPELRHTITAFPADDYPMSVALSPDGQSVAIGMSKGESQRHCDKGGSF
jgi:hypothetical protein